MNYTLPDNFYPTPDWLAEKMIKAIPSGCGSFLEPSAGVGHLVKAIAKKWHRNNFDIDCIEKDEWLRSILAYEFSTEKRKELENKEFEEDWYEKNILKAIANAKVHIVHDDFLSFNPFKIYDAIVMNPPFDDGDRHLLKALDIIKNGGFVVCLLNAETLKNPYSKTRKLLVQKLEELEAHIEYIKDAFKDAERQTDVEIAFITVKIERNLGRSFIWDKLEKAQKVEDVDADCKALVATGNDLGNWIERFRLETRVGLELIREYLAVSPMIMRDFNEKYNYPILKLTVEDNRFLDPNDYLRLVRKKYWRAFFTNPQFTGMLTTNLREEFSNMVDSRADYDFSLYNINIILKEMENRLQQGVHDSIMKLFDQMTSKFTWYSESEQNIHYFNGWKTNHATRIGKKVILPINGFCSDWRWRGKDEFNVSDVCEKLGDIERVLNYLDQGETGEVDIEAIVQSAAQRGQTKNIQLRYCQITLYKKGTCHITWLSEDIVDKLNIYGARNRGWLPPNYGKVHFENLDPEEQEVVESFQGKEGYEKVMSDCSRWIVEPKRTLMLGSGKNEE